MRRTILGLMGASAATLLVATAASAQLASEAQVSVMPTATLVGEVSIDSLLNQPTPAWTPAAQQRKHRLPNGRLTSEAGDANAGPNPSLPQNVEVTDKAPSFASVKGFEGIHSKDNATAVGFELEPPDQGLAVNNNVAVEINNVVLEIFNATTGASLKGPISVAKFFNAAAGNDMTDTQAFFDPSTSRWYLTVIESKSDGTVNDIDLAVSKTSSATGAYYLYKIKAASKDLSGCGGTLDCFPDYPKAGYDANGFYVSVDLFSNTSSGAFVAAATYAMPKSKMIAGAAMTPGRIVYPNDFVVQPSVPAPGQPFVTAANGTEYLLTARGSSVVRLWAISNTKNIVSNVKSLRAHSVDVKTEAYGSGTAASTEPNVVGTYCKSQGVTSAPTLDGGYLAFQSTIQLAASGHLFGVLNFSSPDKNKLDRDALAWFELTPSVNGSTGVPTASVLRQSYLTPTAGYSISYPAFGLNKAGAGVLGMTITNKVSTVVGGYPSTAFIQFTGAATTGNIIVSGKGATSDDGFTGCGGAGPGTVGRWGDYGAATVDAKTGYFYTANENISGARGTYSNWGTHVTQMH